jgi:gamma-glutamyltranspeptidase / glutathione hydrolase
MAPPSSGGSTIGEALNSLEGLDLSTPDRVLALHDYLEASRIAFADRNRWVGDPDQVDVPLAGLLSKGFAAERRCLIGAIRRCRARSRRAARSRPSAAARAAPARRPRAPRAPPPTT